MYELRLEPGPNLIRRAYKVGEVDENVTTRTLEFLNQPVELDPNVTLADIFRLLDHPIMETIYRLDFCREYVEEAKKGPPPKLRLATDPAPDPEDAIEYLELYQVWDVDVKENSIQESFKLDFHGIGVVRTRDSDDGHYKAGQRTHWGLMGSHVRDLLSLPVRWNPEVDITRDMNNMPSRARHPYDPALRTHEVLNVERVSLNQIFHGILWELSFHGAPEEAKELSEEMQRRLESIEDGTAKFIPLEEVLNELHENDKGDGQ